MSNRGMRLGEGSDRAEQQPGPLAAIADDGGILDVLPITAVIPAAEGSFQATQGMEVVGADGIRIGMLKEVRRADILVDRPWKRDVYVPFGAIHSVRDGAIMLTIPADQVDGMGWPHPSLVPEFPT